MAKTWTIHAISLLTTLFTLSCEAAAPRSQSEQFPQALARASSVYLMNSSDIYAMDELVIRLKQWGHFRVVRCAKDAELIMDLQFSRDGYSFESYNIYTQVVTDDDVLSSRSNLILVISDNATHNWTLSNRGGHTADSGSHVLNMINAADGIAGRLRSLVDEASTCHAAVAAPASKRWRTLEHLLRRNFCSHCDCKVFDPNPEQ